MTVKAMSQQRTKRCRAVFANLRALKVVELEFPHDLIPNDIGRCEEPATTARLLVGDGSGLEVDFGVEDMGNSNLGLTGSQGGLYVVVGQDGTGELDLWIGSRGGFPGVDVGELDSAIARLGNRRRFVSVPNAVREGLLVNGFASAVGLLGALGSDFGTCGAHYCVRERELWGRHCVRSVHLYTSTSYLPSKHATRT